MGLKVVLIVDYVHNNTNIQVLGKTTTILWMIPWPSALEGQVKAQREGWDVINVTEVLPPKKPGLWKRFTHWYRCGRHL